MLFTIIKLKTTKHGGEVYKGLLRRVRVLYTRATPEPQPGSASRCGQAGWAGPGFWCDRKPAAIDVWLFAVEIFCPPLWCGRFLGKIGGFPRGCKSKQIHVDISRFCRYIGVYSIKASKMIGIILYMSHSHYIIYNKIYEGDN